MQKAAAAAAAQAATTVASSTDNSSSIIVFCVAKLLISNIEYALLHCHCLVDYAAAAAASINILPVLSRIGFADSNHD